jgi:uncharacterized protein DUF5343
VALSNAYSVAVSRIPDLFAKIRDGQAPELFTLQLLKDWGFSSSNDRAFLPILKALGFLSPDGKPTSVYHDYRDHSRSKAVMGQALKNAYGDIFLIKEHPTEADRAAVQGKFKSYHNVSDNVAALMQKTFYALLSLADLKAATPVKPALPPEANKNETPPQKREVSDDQRPPVTPTLHYNIQIHLPATKDVEVYNAIFKSLRAHLIDD